jgi:transcriptional regulator with XRE-family HTH domain
VSPVNVGSIGEYIRQQREQAKISLRQLASAAGVSNPYLSQIERGLRRPSAEILQQIAKGLRISAEALYVQAGILEDRSPDSGVRAAVLADPELTERQKQVLLEIYESFRRELAGAAGRTQPNGAEPAGLELTGPELPGSELTGSERTGPERTGPERTGPERTGPELTGPERTGPERTGPERTGPELTGPELPGRGTGGPELTGRGTSSPGTGPGITRVRPGGHEPEGPQPGEAEPAEPGQATGGTDGVPRGDGGSSGPAGTAPGRRSRHGPRPRG